MNDTTPSSSDFTKYHEFESFKAEIIPLFSLFEQITFEMYTMSEYVMRIIKKSISDCVMRLNGNNVLFTVTANTTDRSNEYTNPSFNSQMKMSYPSNQFTPPQFVPSFPFDKPQQRPSMWTQSPHSLSMVSSDIFVPSVTGESP